MSGKFSEASFSSTKKFFYITQRSYQLKSAPTRYFLMENMWKIPYKDTLELWTLRSMQLIGKCSIEKLDISIAGKIWIKKCKRSQVTHLKWVFINGRSKFFMEKTAAEENTDRKWRDKKRNNAAESKNSNRHKYDV